MSNEIIYKIKTHIRQQRIQISKGNNMRIDCRLYNDLGEVKSIEWDSFYICSDYYAKNGNLIVTGLIYVDNSKLDYDGNIIVPLQNVGGKDITISHRENVALAIKDVEVLRNFSKNYTL